MKNLVPFTIAMVILASIASDASAQAPQRISYQAVIRGTSGALVANQTISMRISILQGAVNGTAVYVETQNPYTNADGLASIEIGGGTTVSGNISLIDWTNGPFFIRTETDPAGGSNYTIAGSSQMLSVPYSLHAKTAEALVGTITEIDPVFSSSVASGITLNDVATWNNKQDSLIAGTGIQISGDTIRLAGSGAPPHYLGEYFGGGVVFSLWKDSLGTEHGLIISLTNQSSLQSYSNVNNVSLGLSGQSTWNGLSNSNAIVGQAGHSSSAAKLCLDLVSGGQSDWYLPSIDELLLLFNNRFIINRSLNSISGATVLPSSGFFWSSTEYSNFSGCIYIVQEGALSTVNKSTSGNVRAIRAF